MHYSSKYIIYCISFVYSCLHKPTGIFGNGTGDLYEITTFLIRSWQPTVNKRNTMDNLNIESAPLISFYEVHEVQSSTEMTVKQLRSDGQVTYFLTRAESSSHLTRHSLKITILFPRITLI